MTAIPDPIGGATPNLRIHVLDPDGVDRMFADREPAWLIAVAAQLDEDAAADLRRIDRAYEDLWAAVTALTEAAA
jgi:hypothetical protein